MGRPPQCYDFMHIAKLRAEWFEKKPKLLARLRELRDAPEPRVADVWEKEESPHWVQWDADRNLAIELLAKLGEE